MMTNFNESKDNYGKTKQGGFDFYFVNFLYFMMI